MNRSGFGPNGETTDEVWEQLTAEKPSVAKWRYSRFSYYEDMIRYYDANGSARPRLEHMITGDTGEFVCVSHQRHADGSDTDDAVLNDAPLVGRKRVLDNAKEQNAKRYKRRKSASQDAASGDQFGILVSTIVDALRGPSCPAAPCPAAPPPAAAPPAVPCDSTREETQPSSYKRAMDVVNQMVDEGEEVTDEVLCHAIQAFGDERTSKKFIDTPPRFRRAFLNLLVTKGDTVCHQAASRSEADR